MANNLGKLISEKRKNGKLQQQQIANKVGVTNITLCRAQAGQRVMNRERLIRLATVLGVEYGELLEMMDYDLQKEWEQIGLRKLLKDEIDVELFLMLAEVVGDSKNKEILKKVISLLVKADEKEKETLSNMLELLKNGIYGI